MNDDPHRRSTDSELGRLVEKVDAIQETLARLAVSNERVAQQIEGDRRRTEDYNRLTQQTIDRLQREIDDARTTARDSCATEATNRTKAVDEIKTTLSRVWMALGTFALTVVGGIVVYYLTHSLGHG